MESESNTESKKDSATPENTGSTRPHSPHAARWIKHLSQALIVLGVLLLLRLLPVTQAVESLSTWVEQLGPLAPLAFVGAYVVVTVSMLPASVLSLAAGALFGLFTGTLVVLTGATLGMAATFLIARYLARPAVERRFARNPRFSAIDRAVGKGGWKIVALLRLSPAVPFNLQNYLYGLTAIRFWPCILASAVSILPGTFMYVYLGYASRASLGAIGGSDGSRGAGQWALLIIGLIATVAVTIYVTKLARNAIQDQAEVDREEPDAPRDASPEPGRNPWVAALFTALVALVVLTAAAVLYFRPAWIVSRFGPPEVSLSEAYAAKEDSPHIDHLAFAALLSSGQRPAIDWLAYDWSLNSQEILN